MAAKKAVKRAVPMKRAAKQPPAAAKHGKRADLGAPVDEYFARLPADQRVLLEQLRAEVHKAVPTAHEAIKWGMPFYEKDGMLCALSAFKGHVSLNIFAPPELLSDPRGQLEGGGKGMRHLKVRSAADIDRASIQRWLKAAAKHNAS